MKFEPLTAISPVDGRYREKTAKAAEYFSEYALIRYRILVEIEYFIALCEIPLPQLKKVGKGKYQMIRKIYKNFGVDDAQKIKDIEKTTNHDVKAVEYFLKEKFGKTGLSSYKEFIHFGLTSQDINNTAIPLSVKEFMTEMYYPALKQITDKLKDLTRQWKDIPMLAHTHGQPASPTKLGKEIRVFSERLDNQIKLLKRIPYSAKFGGATGNFNAHHVAYPGINWVKFGNSFLNNTLNLERLQMTTQIDHYDNLAALFDNLKRINTILLDLCRDFWAYISMDYFKQKIKKGEVGSSTMPHKVNPIDFENAEGNLGIANSIFEHLSSKLPVSRLQRDLTDSTVTRVIGVPAAHTVLAFSSLMKGLNKVLINKEAIARDLENNRSVVAEAIQTILRREGYPDPYEALKELTRKNRQITAETISDFIDSLDISEKVKKELKKITPENYTGM